MIHINVNQVGIYLIPIYNQVGMIPNLQNFRAQLFKIQNDLFALSIFEIFVTSKVFNFNFYCAMSRQSPVSRIRRPGD